MANLLLSAPGLHAAGRFLARAGYLPERVWAGYPLARVVTFRLQGVTFRYEVLPGDYVGMPLYWLGASGYEPETFEAVRNRLLSASVFIDVGANTGLFSLFAGALNPHLQVLAFEPSPETASQLRRNVELNHFSERIQVIQAAVSDVAGTATFYVPDAAVFATSASLSPTGKRGCEERKVETTTVTLDDFCRDTRPDLIKIDVEGWEASALVGMQRVLATARPDLLIEVLEDAPRETLHRLLEPHGYRFGHLTTGGTVWYESFPAGSAATGRNWLCTTSPCAPRRAT